MNDLQRGWLIVLLLLCALSGSVAFAANDDGAWAPTPPRLSYIDGEVSYWRSGADEWVRARPNLALAEGDAFYTGNGANLEVQFGSRSFVRTDENSQLSLVAQEEHFIQFKLAGGRASFDMRRMTVGDTLEVSTPDAVFTIEHPGYYRMEVDRDTTHFITRRGGEATVTTADGRSLSIYPSEEIVVTAGDPVSVATYAAPPPDDWDRWNDERSDRIGESISSRYLPPEVYGAEELDHYGHWRVVPTYGAVWIPYGMSGDWVPYSTGYWVWDPYYEWTWIDDAPWGWAPFHYGRWIYLDGFWAWTPGPVVQRPLYSPALVAFMIRDHDVSARIGIGLPGLWWVALSWGEPVLPWWGPSHYHGRPWWGGWGGPRIVNNVVINRTTVINVDTIHFHNATLPRAVLTVPADKFGRERIRATMENRYRYTDFAPVRGELPVKPTRASLFGGAPRGVAPPREILARPVVSMRKPRERLQPWQGTAPRATPQAGPEPRYVIPPARRLDATNPPPRPPFGADTGPERAPQPLPRRYEDVKTSVTPPAPVSPRSQTTREQSTERREMQPAARSSVVAPASRPAAPSVQVPRARTESVPQAPVTPRSQTPIREQSTERREVKPAPQPDVVAPPAVRPAAPGGVQAPRGRPEAPLPRGEVRHDKKERPLPGQPANQTYRGRDRENRDAR